MASQSLYRKWRSQTFSDLIGQEATTRTLLNAVREGRLAHAYLFCGPRGTGKTSAARLLAKAINCANPKDGEPCNECLSCREITEGRSPDVIEIDAASNTGVDNIRDLRENVNLLGSGGRYKVYIVDEVHMLSTAAFNALLKTLEEPPPHVIFVLATTEAHKVLPTIVSRCQRFDFRRFTVHIITGRLQHVAAGEGLDLEPAAADLLARAAQGGMRDAVSLLDQAIAYCGTRIDLERTRAMLGLADPSAVRALIEAVAEGRSADMLHQLNELVVNGADLRQLQQQLGEEWRALLLSRAGADVAEVMDRTPDEARDLASLAGHFSLDELMACARVFARSETPARGLPTPQLALELALLECLTVRRTGGAASQPAIPAGATQARPTAPPLAAASAGQPSPAHTSVASSTPPAPTSSGHANAAGLARHVEELDLGAVAHELDEMFGGDGEPSPVPPAPPPPPQTEDLRATPPRKEAAVAPVETAAHMTSGVPDLVARARAEWAVVKKVCKQQSASTAALLSHAAPVRCDPGSPPVLVIEAQFEFHYEKLKAPKAREAVEWAVEQVLEMPVRARFILAGKQGGSTAAGTTGTTGSNGAAGTNRANGANGATRAGGGQASSAPLTRLDRASPAAESRPAYSREAAPGAANGALHGPGASANGHRAQQNGHASAPSQPGADAGRHVPSGNGHAPNPARLEDEARSDAIVQEIQRELGAQLLDVRPLDPDGDGER